MRYVQLIKGFSCHINVVISSISVILIFLGILDESQIDANVGYWQITFQYRGARR